MSIIDDIKSRIDIVEYIGRDADLRKSGSNFKCCCPLPGHDEKTASFTIYPDTQTWRCYGGGCNRGGSVIDYVMEMESVELDDAIDTLCKELGIDRQKGGKGPKIVKRPNLARKMISDYMHEQLLKNEEALRYLQGDKRGLSMEDIKVWGMGLSTGNLVIGVFVNIILVVVREQPVQV